MYEIEPAVYEQVRPLFPNIDVHLAVKALLSGNVQGQVYVDDSTRPQSAMACIGELFYLGGSPEKQTFNRELSQFFVELVYPQRIASDPGRFIIKCTVDGWAWQIDVFLPGKFPIPKRQQYYVGGEVRHDWRAMLAPDITIRTVDRGFTDVNYLQTLPWLESLRETAEWTQLMQHLEAKAAKKGT